MCFINIFLFAQVMFEIATGLKAFDRFKNYNYLVGKYNQGSKYYAFVKTDVNASNRMLFCSERFRE